MKKIFLFLFTAVTLCAYAQTKPDAAVVDQISGIYIYAFCKPVKQYSYIGSIVIKTCMNCQGEEMITIAIKKLKKDFPAGNAIIFTSKNLNRAEIVKIENQ